MLDFKRLTLDDIPLIEPFFQKEKSRMCDYTIGSALMWRDYFQTEYVIQDEVLYFKMKYLQNEIAFDIPLGGDLSAIHNIIEYCNSNQLPVIFCNVTTTQLALLDSNFDNIQVKVERDWFDYIYDVNDITKLVGRKFSGQRNHINKFKRQFPHYTFEVVQKDNIEKVKSFYSKLATTRNLESAMAQEEDRKVMEVLDLYDVYKPLGGFVQVDDQIVGMSMGEIVNDTLFIHIEKANTEYPGAYQILVNEFSNHFVTEDVKYINREEDIGDEGLRTSKTSYHPIELIEKHTIKIL